ncbi:hypothetical protein POM88_033368 [Heracleum sosnowskyi]|uniref:F-box domain-containing protein n=1 Tax=Heracleum sosnowskyi TaxID=360622 RepID=A0AAD8MIG4_9APIA|nr:hypothetical protein POM88_033368 [Heracleum sosnowskyi]
MRSLLCCIPEILKLLTESLWPLAKEALEEPLIEEPVVEEAKAEEEKTESSMVATCKRLPEELVIDILSRFPAESLHQCAEVYQDWKSLFSTRYFVHDLFLPRVPPTFIVHRASNVEDELYYLDDFWGDGKKTPIKFKIKDDPLIWGRLELKYSYFGLLFFTSASRNYTVVLNPVTCEKTYLLHDGKGLTDIYGVYYHPIAREFCVLLISHITYEHAEFKLLRERGPSRGWETLSNSLYLPVGGVPPVNLHGALHWKRRHTNPISSHSIVVFSIVEEEFKLMPHPDPGGAQVFDEHLFDLDGNLALCQITDVLQIRTLQDYTSWFWTKTHSIKLGGLDHLRRPFWFWPWVYVLGAQNGTLIIHQLAKGIFAPHLEQNTSKKFVFNNKQGSLGGTSVCLHTKSLLSFRAFHPSAERYQLQADASGGGRCLDDMLGGVAGIRWMEAFQMLLLLKMTTT